MGLDPQYLNFSWDAEHGNFFFRNPEGTGTGPSDVYITAEILKYKNTFQIVCLVIISAYWSPLALHLHFENFRLYMISDHLYIKIRYCGRHLIITIILID